MALYLASPQAMEVLAISKEEFLSLSNIGCVISPDNTSFLYTEDESHLYKRFH